ALETLRSVEGPIDLVFLDGYPPLYLPIVEMLAPKLRSGAVVIADNVFTHRRLLRDYRAFVRKDGFRSQTLWMRFGVEYSVRV
ncbi:MAG TPA: hypothetical protein VIV65_10535, partial [Gemmatimonadaceae bacterium]